MKDSYDSCDPMCETLWEGNLKDIPEKYRKLKVIGEGYLMGAKKNQLEVLKDDVYGITVCTNGDYPFFCSCLDFEMFKYKKMIILKNTILTHRNYHLLSELHTIWIYFQNRRNICYPMWIYWKNYGRIYRISFRLIMQKPSMRKLWRLTTWVDMERMRKCCFRE